MIAELNSEQRMLADSLDKLLTESWDIERRRAVVAANEGAAKDLWPRFAELGWLRIGLPAEDGIGGPIETALVMEAFGRALMISPYLSSIVLSAPLLATLGTAAQKDRFLAALVEGRHLVAFAAAEPAARYDLHDVQTTARTLDGGYRLDGQKSLVLDGADADTFIVAARTAGARHDSGGLTLFLVPARTAGIEIRGYRMYDGHAAADLTLRDVRVGPDAVLGSIDHAWADVERAVDRAIAALCAEAVGAMSAAYAMTIEYLNTRGQFGRTIGGFQAIQHRMADLFAAVEETRSLALAAAMSLDGDRATRRRFIAAAKIQAGRAGKLVADESIQLHGAIGMTDEYAIGHFAKRLLAIDALFGDADHHLGLFPIEGSG